MKKDTFFKLRKYYKYLGLFLLFLLFATTAKSNTDFGNDYFLINGYKAGTTIHGNCDGTIEIKFMITDFDNINDGVDKVTLYLNGSPILRGSTRFTSFDGYNLTQSKWDDGGSGGGEHFYYSVYNLGIADYLINFNKDNNKIWYITITIKKPDMTIPSNSVRLDMYWNRDLNNSSGSDTHYDNTFSVPVPYMGPVTNFKVSTTECDVNLSWTNPNYPENCLPNYINEIYKDGVLDENGNILVEGELITTITNNSNAYTDKDPGLLPGVMHNYYIKTLVTLSNSELNVFTGQTKAVLGSKMRKLPVKSITASDNNCGRININWTVEDGDNPQKFRIESGTWVQPDIPSTSRSFDINIPNGIFELGKIYNFKVSTYNGCEWDIPTLNDDGGSYMEPTAPVITNTTRIGSNFQIDWAHTPLAANPLSQPFGFIVERTVAGGGEIVSFKIADPNLRTYTDITAKFCTNYIYKVYAYNDCSKTGVASNASDIVYLPADLSTTFDATHKLKCSKGYFPNYINLSWNNNNQYQIDFFNIYRKEFPLGTEVKLATIPSSSSTFNDQNAVSGVLYQYRIQGEGNCAGNRETSNSTIDIGLRSPVGTVAGHVEYEGGIAVKDAKIYLTRVSGLTGKSASFDGVDDYIDVTDADALDANSNLTIESWVMPSTLKSDNYIISKGSDYALYINNKRPVFVINGMNFTSGTDIVKQDQWQHIAATYNGTIMKIFVDGVCIDSLNYVNAINVNTNNLYIGRSSASNYFSGNLDELRISNIAKTNQQIALDYGRILTGNEDGIVASWTFDEGNSCPFVFDKAKTGNTYLENTGNLMNGVIFSNSIPTSEQLGFIGITDKNGDYTIQGIRYNGAGENYKLSPVFGIHQFSPSSKTLFIGEGSNIHNGQDFKDISAFDVSGNVKFAGTNCPSKDIILQIDGVPVIKNGQAVMTDADGNFTIKVPIGKHQVSVMRSGHEFSQGIFPPTGDYDFQETLPGIQFFDATLITVVGRVVGGLDQKGKSPVLGRCTNNIGRATIVFKTLSDCNTYSVTTADSSGQYMIKLPPMKYTIPDFSITSNPAISFKNNNLLDLSINTPIVTKVDTLFIAGTHSVKQIDSVQFHKQLDFIYREVPKMKVTNAEGTDPFIGEKSFPYISQDNSDTTIISLDPNPFPFPFFKQSKIYKARIKCFEIYTNKDKGINNWELDTVPVTQGKITINNELATVSNTIIELTKGDTLYEFRAGNPNPTKNTLTPLFDYTKVFAIQMQSGTNTIDWKPLSLAAGEYYRGYILGSQSADGQSFITNGPEVVDFILRDPPGSLSYATLEKNSSLKTTETFSIGGVFNKSGQSIIKAGTKFATGIGFVTDNKMQTSTVGGWTNELKLTESGEFSQNTTLTETKATNSDPVLVGAESDLFIGKSRNMEFGLAYGIDITPEEVYTLDKVDEAATIVNINGVNYSVARRNTLMVVPGGYETGFAYTRNYIEDYLIPKLQALRNQLFVQQPNAYNLVFTDISDEKYATNNDDPIWGIDVTSDDEVNTDAADYNGKSYIFTKLTNESIDSVRVFNQQIRLWHQALKKDEQEKANAIAKGDIERNISYAAGASESYSSSTTNTWSETTTIEYNLTYAQKTKIDMEIAGVGVELETGISLGIETQGAIGASGENTTTIGYTLLDSDIGDDFSIDVYKSEKNGPMFRTRAGQTSCPWEKGFTSKYLDTETKLSLSTLKREVPTILANGIKSAKLTNIPADQPASFNLTLGNESESSEDWVYDIRILESSNPHGAIIKMDGTPVFREISVPANSSVNKILTIEKGSGDVYQYDSIMVLFHSQCQFSFNVFSDIVDTAYVSAYFIPTCTNINIINPTDKWVVNNSNHDTLNAIISNYNVNFAGLKDIKFWYRPSNESSWVGLETWHKDTTGLSDPTAKQITSSENFTLYPWDLGGGLKDGYYDIKASSTCTFAEKESTIFSGVIDRVNPHPFGNPQPADGILSPDDEIQINFNEKIDDGLVNSFNFDIIGVLNQSELHHDASLYFDGVDDYLEISDGLSLKNSFSIEFWVKRDNTGAETVFSQGINPNQSVSVLFNANNNLVLNINGNSVASDFQITNDNNWYHAVCAYNDVTGEIQTFIASDANNYNTSKTISTDYNEGGTIFIGKNSDNSQTFKGYLHELRIWSKALSLAEATERMNISMTGKEFNLLGCWPMDEVRGNLAADIARHRNAKIHQATWSILPSGRSIAFNGNDNYLTCPSSAVSVTNEMDFTIEFWLKGGIQTDTVAFISNGKGTSNYPIGWSILASPDGKIQVKNNDYTFKVNNPTVFDNSWHHFALVVNRIGNTNAYLDGTLSATTSSQNWDGLGGNKLWIGCKGWYDASTENRSNYFKGSIDEVRFWHLARKQEQIERDMVNRLKGNESGLLIYLPFEKYVTSMGVQKLETTLTNIVDGSNAIVNSESFSTDVPVIKSERPVSSIPFTYSVNNDKIIVTPNIDAALIENVTLDITCKGIKDMHGNVMQSPKTWIAYVDRNQVIWQDQELSFDKKINDPLSFNANILNNGGEMKTFSIKNLPNWLTVDKKEGSISPNSFITLSFVVDPSVNIGNYEEAISVVTDFGYNESLLLKLNVSATAPDWTVNPEKFQYSMNVIGQLKIDDVISNDPNDIIYAFVGNECRGVAKLKYVDAYDMYEVFIDIYSNLSQGEKVEFKIWNASEGIVQLNVTPNYTFESGAIHGTASTPEIFSTFNSYSYQKQLVDGWKWVSVNLNSPDLSEVKKIMANVIAKNGDQIKGQSAYDNYSETLGWNGSLTNTGGFSYKQMYMVKLSRTDTLSFSGAKLDPSTVSIPISNGWNWIGYTPQVLMTTNEAMGYYTPNAGDVVKSQYSFSIFDPAMGWIGSLAYMKPGEGYMYKSTASTNGSLTYPNRGMNKSGVDENPNNSVAVEKWSINKEAYSLTLSVIGHLIIDETVSADHIVGAFVGDECRGIAEPININGEMKYFITVYGSSLNEIINFKLFNKATGEIRDILEQIDFVPDNIVGEINNSQPLTAMQTTGILEMNKLAENVVSVYPNPTNGKITIDLNGFESYLDIELEITDIVGKIVYKSTMNEIRKTLDISSHKKGVYFVKITTAEGVYTDKIILQ